MGHLEGRSTGNKDWHNIISKCVNVRILYKIYTPRIKSDTHYYTYPAQTFPPITYPALMRWT